MKKRLLLMMAAVMGMAASAFAFGTGDMVYTHSGKYKVVGENLLTNGDFSDGLNGWKGLGGSPMSVDTFTVKTTGGPEGKPYIEVTLGGGTMGSTLVNSSNFRNSVRLSAGNYIVSYKIKAFTGGVTSNARWGGRNDNYQDVFTNNDGNSPYPTETDDNKVQASLAEWIDTKADEWMTISYYYHADADIYINMEFFNLIVGDCFADFGVYPVTEVGDTRLVETAIKTLEYFTNDPVNFPGADEALAEPLADLKGNLENPELTVGDVATMLSGIIGTDGSALQAYLDGISADVSSYFNHFTFDDCTEKGANRGAAEGWTESGGRWGVKGAWQDMYTRNIIGEIGANYGLGDGSQYQTAALPKGKYLYMVKASGTQYYANGSGKTSNYYIPDYYNQREGLSYFINKDTVQMADVPTWSSNTYINIFDVTEDGDQTIGFHRAANAKFAGNDRNKTSGGGIVRFDNMYLRILGATDEDVKAYFLAGTLANSQNALKTMIDSAKAVINKVEYNFGKAVLRDSISHSDAIYAECTQATEANIATLDAQMPYMRQAIRDYYTVNVEYKTLGDDIAVCKVLAADETRPNGKDVFNAAINVAETYYNGLTETSERDSLALVKADSTLMVASQVFQFANANYRTPASINLVNADFSDGTNGWSIDAATGNAVWKTGYQDTETFKGRCVYFNRGTPATDDKYIYQDVKIENTGVYELFATCAVHNSNWNTIEGYNTSTYLFAGKDSVNVISVGPGVNEQVLGSFAPFSVLTTVESLEGENLVVPGYLRIGLEKHALEDGTSVGVNMIYMGGVKLLYYGSKEVYETGVTDVEVVDGTFDIYSINGMKIRSNAKSFNGLTKGLYLVNGKKYVVK